MKQATSNPDRSLHKQIQRLLQRSLWIWISWWIVGEARGRQEDRTESVIILVRNDRP